MPYSNLPESDWPRMDSCVESVMAQGHDNESAIAICYTSLAEGKAAPEPAPAPKSLTIDGETLVAFGGALKALGETPDGGLHIGGYLVVFGGPDKTDRTPKRDFFTRQTDFGAARETDVYYNHRLPLETKDGGEIIVKSKWGKGALTLDDVGVFIDAVTFNRDKYDAVVNQAVKATLSAHGWSSGTATHLVERVEQPNGSHWLKSWPLGLDASITPIPAEPLSRVIPLKSLSGQSAKSIAVQDAPEDSQKPGVKASTNSTKQEKGRPMATVLERLQEYIPDLTPAQLAGMTAEAVAKLLEGATMEAHTEESAEAPAPGEAPAAMNAAPKSMSAQNSGAPNQTGRKSVARLPFTSGGEANEAPAPTAAEFAVKSWYVKRYGELDAGVGQISKELYGLDNPRDFMQLTYLKNQAFRRYLHMKDYDQRMARTLVYSPEQLIAAFADGVSLAEIKATMIEAQDTLGGFITPQHVETNIISRLPGLTVVRPLANVMATSTNRVLIPTSTGGNSRYTGAVRGTWTDETPASASTTNTNGTFGQVAIPVHTLMANVNLSRDFVEDASSNIEKYLTDQFVTALAILEDEAFLVGNGTGRPRGVLLDSTTGGPSSSDITTVNSGAAAALTADGIVALEYGLAGQYRQAASCSFAAAKATVQATAQLKSGDGNYLWGERNRQFETGQPRTLRGYALRESEALPSIAANQYPIVFAAWDGYTIADRIGLSIERYMDSNTVNTNTVTYYARRRLGGQVTEGWKFVVQKVSA